MPDERHPCQVRMDLPTEERLKLLERNLARLWDQVWWMQLPAEKRFEYEALGFASPIPNFYEPEE